VLDDRDRLPSEQSGSKDEIQSWTEPPMVQPGVQSAAGYRKSDGSVARTKGATKSYEVEGEGGARRVKGLTKRPATSDTSGPRIKRDLPDLKIELDCNRSERKAQCTAGRRDEGVVTFNEADAGRVSSSVAAVLKPVVEVKIKEAVRGMITEAINGLTAAQNNFHRNGQKSIRDMMGQNKTDLVTCIKNVEEVVQQTLSNGSEDLQNSATELVQRIESAVTEVCDSSAAKVGQLVEQHLKTYGSSVKEAISDLAQKEAEVQRHLNNVFSELSEIRRKLNNDLPAVQWQVAAGPSETVGASMGVEIQNAVVAGGGAAEGSVGGSAAVAVENAVMVAVGRSDADGAGDLNTPPVEKDEMLEDGDEEVPSSYVDPGLLDQPCENAGW